jgi:hypothetical protein
MFIKLNSLHDDKQLNYKIIFIFAIINEHMFIILRTFVHEDLKL